MRTLNNLIEDLQNLKETHPECGDFQIIYSHDDEGNEYQRVINGPALVQLYDPDQESYRHLEVVGFNGNVNAVIIN